MFICRFEHCYVLRTLPTQTIELLFDKQLRLATCLFQIRQPSSTRSTFSLGNLHVPKTTSCKKYRTATSSSLLLSLHCECVIAAADNMPQTKTVKHSATTIVCFCQMRVTETLLWPMAQNCHRCLQGTRQDEVLSTLYNERGPCPNHLLYKQCSTHTSTLDLLPPVPYRGLGSTLGTPR